MTPEQLARKEVEEFLEEPVVVPAAANVASMIAAMGSRDAYEVFIEGIGKTGIVSMRDLLGVPNVTTTKPAAIIKYAPRLSPNTLVSEAAGLMTHYRLRALPIVRNSKVTGQITAGSIINSMKGLEIKAVKVSSVMTAHPITIPREDPVSKARSIMLRRRIDHLPVMKDSKLFGIVTSSKIVKSMMPTVGVKRGAYGAEGHRRLDFPVDRIAEKDVLTCGVNEDVNKVIDSMAAGKTCAIATLWDEVQGIITQRDIINLIVRERKKEEIPIYIVGLPDDPFEAEAASQKFRRTVALLRRTIPSLEEASSIIETSHVRGKRRHYEVRVSLKTPYKTFNYVQDGWELPQIYDILVDRMKRILAQRPTKKRASRRTYGSEHLE